MPKLFMGIHEPPIKNSNAKCLMENWIEERAVEKLDDGKKDVQGVPVNKEKIIGTHLGLVTSACDSALDDLTVSLDTYRPRDLLEKTPSRSRAAAMEKVFLEQAIREVRERKRREEESTQEDIAELKKANIVIKNTNVCPLAETFKEGFVNEQPVTFWSKHSKGPLGVTKVGDISFRKNASFTTPVQLSFSSHPNSLHM